MPAFPAGSPFALGALAVAAIACSGDDACAADGHWPHTDDWKEARVCHCVPYWSNEWSATNTTMKTPPDPRRANTSRPLAAPLSQPTGGPRSHPLMTAPPSQPLDRSQPLAGPLSQPSRLQLSGLIDDRIEWLAARERQRAWLVTTVVLAQALITLMVVPGYLIPSANLPLLLTLGVALVFYLVAFLFNRVRRDVRVAIFMLIGGGALATAAQAFATALLNHGASHTAQAALLFLPIILEAGLFLTPELTLVVASASAVLTASAILLALALASDSSSQLNESYLVMVYALGLEAFIGYLAWRLAQFIYETVKTAQADEDLRFAQARLAATERQVIEQRRQLMQDVGVIQMAVSSALAHVYETNIEIVEGDLAPLAASVTLLIQQLRATNDLERKLAKMEAQAVPLVEMATRLASGSPPPPTTETQADTSLYSVAAALRQAHAIIARRQARLQEVATDVAVAVKHSREGIANTAAQSARAQQLAGQLVSLAETLTETSQRQSDLLAQARRALAMALPPEIAQSDASTAALQEPAMRDAEGANGLLGLGPDIGIMRPEYTGEFPILEPFDGDVTGIPPLTTPLPAVSALTGADAEHAGGDASDVDLPASLADAWMALTQLQGQTLNETRYVLRLAYDLGVLARHVRHAGANIDWVNQSIDFTEQNVERLQQLAGGSAAGADLGDDTGHSGSVIPPRPAPPSIPRFAPMPTRPLQADARITTEPEEEAPASPSQPLNEATQHITPAPGTLRVSDLIGFDVLRGPGSDAGDASLPGADAPDEADPQARWE